MKGKTAKKMKEQFNRNVLALVSYLVKRKVEDNLNLEAKKVAKMNIWDTPGGDHFTRARSEDYNNADIVIMVYAIDRESSFDSMDDLYQNAKKFGQNSLYFLVGNKVDLDKKGLR